MAQVALGEIVRSLRSERGMTQEELARAASLPAAQTVSDIERGVRDLKAWELVRLSRVLNCSIDRLLGIEPAVDAARVLWRRGSKGRSAEVERRFVDRARRFQLLEDWNSLPPRPPFPQYDFDPASTSFRDAATLATQVGRALDLGSRPAASLSVVLQEVYRVKIFHEPLGEDGSAASSKGPFGCAVLMNADEAPWRQNYNLAHEVFHLATWDATVSAWDEEEDEPGWLEQAERLANAFASHLLLPAEEVEAQFEARLSEGEVSYADLVEMAREFEVSTEALVWRLRLMSRLTQTRAEEILADPEFRRIDRRSMMGRWEAPPEEPLPARYWRLAFNAYHKGEVTLSKLARMLERPISEIGALLMQETDEPETTASPA